MARYGVLAAILMGCVFVSSGHTQSSSSEETKRSSSPMVVLDSNLVFTHNDDAGALKSQFQQNTARPLTSYLSTSADQFYGFQQYELSRFDCTLEGASVGMTIGMIAGAMGMTMGDWDESTGWYVAGAAALLGALWGGGVKADDPGFTVRLRWDPSSQDRQ